MPSPFSISNSRASQIRREPAALAARYPSQSARSDTAWALGLLGLLHAPQIEGIHLSVEWGHDVGFEPAVLARLRECGIGTRIADYGVDLQRFEADLYSCDPHEPVRYPLVSVPGMAEIDWRTGALSLRPRTFVVDYENGVPVFLTREQPSGAILRIDLQQMRLLHDTWRRWPIVLPSMLLTVLWHWRC